MSFDSSLRTALLRGSEPIAVDADRGLTEVAERIRSGNRRRLSLKAVGVVLLVITVVWWPQVGPIERRTYVPPAREKQVTPRPDAPEGRDRVLRRAIVPGSDHEGRPLDRSRSRDTVEKRSRSTSTHLPNEPRSQPTTPAEVPLDSWSRVIEERYEVNYVAGTYVGENGSGGCWEGAGATGSNDCMPFQVGAAESQVTVDLISDDGSTVGVRIYEYHRGESTDHGVFCGATGPITVHPEALLKVRIDTSGQCSDQRPTTGQVVVRFR